MAAERRLLIDLGCIHVAETMATLLGAARHHGISATRSGTAILLAGPAEGVESLRELVEQVAGQCGRGVRVLEV